MVVRKQGPWGLWWLTGITCSVYYFVWYARINAELAAVTNTQVPSDGKWWSQLIPIYSLIGLAKTAGRVNAAHAAVGSPTRVDPFMAWFLAPCWFGSQTRYLQRRINILHDVIAAKSTQPGGQPSPALQANVPAAVVPAAVVPTAEVPS